MSTHRDRQLKNVSAVASAATAATIGRAIDARAGIDGMPRTTVDAAVRIRLTILTTDARRLKRIFLESAQSISAETRSRKCTRTSLSGRSGCRLVSSRNPRSDGSVVFDARRHGQVT